MFIVRSLKTNKIFFYEEVENYKKGNQLFVVVHTIQTFNDR